MARLMVRRTLAYPRVVLPALLALLACDGSSTETLRPEEIAISAAAEVVVGQSIPLAAAVRDQRGAVMPGHAVTWISLTPTTAVIENDSVLRGMVPGEAVIQATAGTATAQVVVAVRPVRVASVTMIPDYITATQLGTRILHAIAFDERGVALPPRLALWTSSDTALATVETLSPGYSSALLKAWGIGVGRITVTIDGVSSSAALVVHRNPYPP